MGADAAERRRRVKVSARKIETITGPQYGINQRRPLALFLDSILVIIPGLITQRRFQNRPMNPPALLTLDLQNKHVMDVVVRAEALVLRGSDVRICLDGVAELGCQPLAELQDGRPDTMQCLQDES